MIAILPCENWLYLAIICDEEIAIVATRGELRHQKRGALRNPLWLALAMTPSSSRYESEAKKGTLTLRTIP